MKFNVTFKCPDAVDNALDHAVAQSLPKYIDKEEAELLFESRREKAKSKLEKFVTYGEYLTVQFDLEAGTATVVEN